MGIDDSPTKYCGGGHGGSVVDVGIASTGARLEADVRHVVELWHFRVSLKHQTLLPKPLQLPR